MLRFVLSTKTLRLTNTYSGYAPKIQSGKLDKAYDEKAGPVRVRRQTDPKAGIYFSDAEMSHADAPRFAILPR
jgi:hypothetical protein